MPPESYTCAMDQLRTIIAVGLGSILIGCSGAGTPNPSHTTDNLFSGLDRPHGSGINDPAFERRMDALIRNLDSNDFRIRARAAEDLNFMGELALPRLLRVAKASSSAEVRALATTAVGEIESMRKAAEERGREAVGGLRLFCRPEKTIFRSNESIRVTIVFHNTSPQPLPFIPIRKMDNHIVKEEGYWDAASHGDVVLVRLTGDGSGSRRGCGRPQGTPDRTLLSLPPGERWAIYDSQEFCDLRPGDFALFAVYYAQSKSLIPGAESDLRSNVVRIRVVAPPDKK